MILSKWWWKLIFVCTFPLKETVKEQKLRSRPKKVYINSRHELFQRTNPNLMVSRCAGVSKQGAGLLCIQTVFSEEGLCDSLWCWEWPGNSLRDYSQHQPGQMAECLFTKCNFSQRCAKCSARHRWSASCGHRHTHLLEMKTNLIAA